MSYNEQLQRIVKKYEDARESSSRHCSPKSCQTGAPLKRPTLRSSGSVQSWSVLGVGVGVGVLPPPAARIPTAGGEEKNDTKSKNYGQA
jgi:hypothetical protein